MPQGNWKCSSCGSTITELPFTPRSEAGLTCRACYAKRKGGGAGTSGSSAAPTFAGSGAQAPDIPFDAPLASEPAHGDDLGMGEVPVSSERQKVSGNWTCAGCGGDITSLPFTPRSTNNLKCLDCFKQSRG